MSDKKSYQLIMTAFLSVIGGIIGLKIGLPLPWMIGPMVIIMIYCALGQTAFAPKIYNTPARGILGYAIGSQFSPDSINAISHLGIGLALVPINSILIIIIGYQYFRRICRYEPATAFFGAIPGGLLDMVSLGEQFGADRRQLTLFHATRLGGTVLFASLLVSFYPLFGKPEVHRPLLFTHYENSAIIVFFIIIGYFCGKLTKLPAFPLLGPMILSAILHGSGLIDIKPAYILIIIGQSFVGARLGSEFNNTNYREFRTTITRAVIFTMITFVPTILSMAIMAYLTDMKPLTALLSFAPGGQSEMSILAFAVGAPVAIVALHQLWRVSLVLLSIPILPWVMKKIAQ